MASTWVTSESEQSRFDEPLLHLFPAPPLLCRRPSPARLENLALRQQLAVYRRALPRPKLHTMDRSFWAGLTRTCAGWRQAMVIVSSDAVLRWQRRRCRECWAHLSGRHVRGCPCINPQIAVLVRTMAAANPMWVHLYPTESS